MKLWQKNNQELNSFIETFETKDDLLLDQKLLIFDVYGSIAHAKMLQKIGILTKQELSDLEKGLNEIISLSEQGMFMLQQGDEDIHTKIENFLTEKYGEVGKKIHTGRSRNDQVLTATRLYTKNKLLAIWKDFLLLTESFQEFSKQYEFVAMPGYTHMQKAMPSSVGMWANAFTQAFLDNLITFKASYEVNDQSPLGSAAGYGVPLPLDREYTSELLGFNKVQTNPIYCQNSRGKIEANIVSALTTMLLDINRFATDVLFFTTSELDYFKVSADLCSGSSIMPQKKNVDIAELLRSKVHLLAGQYMQIITVSSSLISGYNRDTQDSKKPFIESLELAHDSIKAATILINNINPNEEKLKQAMTPELFATHHALELVSDGIPFREAYMTIGKDLNQLAAMDSEKALKQSTHIGGTGNLLLSTFDEKIQNEQEIIEKEGTFFHKTLKNLTNIENISALTLDKGNIFL